MNISHINKLLFTVLILGAFAFGQDSTHYKYHFALVLSGGGARGLAQIGVLKALEEANIKPDIIIGTSMGAIVASLYSCGYSADSIQAIAKSVNWNSIFANTSVRKKMFVSQKTEPINYLLEFRFDYNFKPLLPNSISYGQAFYDLLAPKLTPAQFRAGTNFDSLPIPLRVIATDIVSGEKVVFSKGNLATAVRASCGVPLAFSPVSMGDMLLMDGGLAANIPVETAKEEGAEIVLAIDVTSPLWNRAELENPVHLVDQLVSIGITKQKEHEKALADFIIKPNLKRYINTGFDHLDSLIESGYSATVQVIDSLKKILSVKDDFLQSPGQTVVWNDKDSVRLEKINIFRNSSIDKNILFSSNSPINTYLDKRGLSFSNITIHGSADSTITFSVQTTPIKNIEIDGNERTSTTLIRTAIGLNSGDTLTKEALQRAMSSLYSTDLFENVNIDLDTAGKLRVIVEEKKYWRTRMGLRFDEFHLGEGFLEPAYENLFGYGILGVLHLQYGLRREKYAFELQGNHLFTNYLANNLQLQAYISKELIFGEVNNGAGLLFQEEVLRKTGIIALFGTQVGRFALFSIGVHLERFKVQLSDMSAFNDVLGLQFKDGLVYLMMRLTIDTMDKFPFPTTGQKHYFSVGGTSKAVGAKDDFLKVNGSFGRYITFSRKHTFFPQLRFAWSSSHLPEVEKVYLGGVIPEERYRDMGVYNYVPFLGLEPRALPGDMMSLLHLDYRLKIDRGLYLNSGVDWGYVWAKEKFSPSMALDDFVKNAPVGIGFGISYETIVGPIRFSYGQLLHDVHRFGLKSKPRFYFSAGHDF